MKFIIPFVLATAGFASPSQADAAGKFDSGWAAAFSCVESKDWTCAFDGFRDLLWVGTQATTCRNQMHGCDYAIYAIYVSSIGAAASAEPETRRRIAEEGLAMLEIYSDGSMNEIGEVPLSALQHDACKSLGDLNCMQISAANIILASGPFGFYEYHGWFDNLLAEFDLTYPLDLNEVIEEVRIAEAPQ